MKMQINISLQRNQWMMQEVLVVKCLLLTGIWCFIPWKAICGYIYTNPAALQWEVNIYLREIERPVKISSSVRFFWCCRLELAGFSIIIILITITTTTTIISTVCVEGSRSYSLFQPSVCRGLSASIASQHSSLLPRLV